MSTDELRKMFKMNLREVLRRKGWTRVKLAEVTGLTEATIENYVCGKSMPYNYNLWLLCQALGVTSSDLFGF